MSRQPQPAPYDASERAPLLNPNPGKPAPYPGPLSPSPYGHNYGPSPNSEAEAEEMRRRKPTPTHEESRGHYRRRAGAACCLVLLFVIALAVVLGVWDDGLSDDPLEAARELLAKSPVIDGHIDLPILVRERYRNNVSAVNLEESMPGHVDIPRLRQGQVGAFFWSVYVDCKPDNANFTLPSYRVRDTLEQIDVAHALIEAYPSTFAFSTTAHDIRSAIRSRKIASLIGIEGAHQLGNSLSVLRQYFALGARYMTLTHTCNNAFADSGGMTVAPEPTHGGLSKIGEALVREMNRLGMLVDLSHTSDETAEQALRLCAEKGAPVIWSHSSSRALKGISRNVPDALLEKLTTEETGLARWKGKTDGVVMVNFAPYFIAEENGQADVNAVADHVEHMARVAGKEYVGIGSDFDGIASVPRGLEDVSKYPDLVAELYARGWSRRELAGFTGGNFLRVLERAEKIAREMKEDGVGARWDVYEGRGDL